MLQIILSLVSQGPVEYSAAIKHHYTHCKKRITVVEGMNHKFLRAELLKPIIVAFCFGNLSFLAVRTRHIQSQCYLETVALKLIYAADPEDCVWQNSEVMCHKVENVLTSNSRKVQKVSQEHTPQIGELYYRETMVLQTKHY